MKAFISHISHIAETDEELLEQFMQGGDQQVLARLYLRYTDMVMGVCLKYLKDADAAQDAVMNIYQELTEKLPRQQVLQFRPWLYVVVKNHCLMLLRRERKAITVELNPAIMQSEDFTHLENVLEKEQEFKKLEQCLERLPEGQRESISMFYLENKCYNEIAAATQQDWNKVRSLIQNGRRNLKICMDSHG